MRLRASTRTPQRSVAHAVQPAAPSMLPCATSPDSSRYPVSRAVGFLGDKVERPKPNDTNGLPSRPRHGVSARLPDACQKEMSLPPGAFSWEEENPPATSAASQGYHWNPARAPQ